MRQRRLVDEQPGRFGPRAQVGEPVRDGLMLSQQAAEGRPASSAYSIVRSSAARAMPIANAPTLGRNRSSVRIATRKPEARLAEDLLRRGVDAVEMQRADRVRREQLEALARQTVGVAFDRERRQSPRATRVGIRSANTVYTSASGAFEIHSLSPCST